MTDPNVSPVPAPIPFSQEIFRKLIHLSSFWMVAVIWFNPYDRVCLCYFFGILLILNLLCEFAYSCKVPVITPLFRFFFGKMLRKEPRRGQWVVSGSPPVFAAALLICLFYPQYIAAISLGVMLIADTAAALIGRRFGRHKINGKSWEGVFAFQISGILLAFALLACAGQLRTGMAVCAIAGVILASFAELFEKQLHIDDNLSIPLLTGACLLIGNNYF